MPRFLSQSGFAKLIGVSPPAINQAIKNDRLEIDPRTKKIDTESDKAKKFIAFHRMASRSNGKREGRPIRSGEVFIKNGDAAKLLERQQLENNNENSENEEGEKIAAGLKRVDLHIKQFKAAKEKIYYDELIKKVIPFELVAHAFNIISATIEQEFGNFDSNNADLICDQVESGKDRADIREWIRNKIEEGTLRVKKSAHTAMERLRVGE